MENDFLTVMPNLRVVCDNVVLKIPTLEQGVALAKIAYDGLFPDGEDITISGWYDPKNPAANAFSVMEHLFRSWKTLGQSPLRLPMVVMENNVVVGTQSFGDTTNAFKITRELGTGSYLIPDARGKGVGTKARHCALALGFNILGASEMVTSALATNIASNRVSEKCGYLPDGKQIISDRGQRKVLNRYRLTREQYRASKHPIIRVRGYEQLAQMFVPGEN